MAPDAVVVGDRRKYVAALILVDEETVSRFAEDQRVSYSTFAELTRAPEVVGLLQREVDAVNATLSKPEAIKKFALLPRRLFVDEGDVTPTMKVKRRAVEERYADLIRALYED